MELVFIDNGGVFLFVGHDGMDIKQKGDHTWRAMFIITTPLR